MKIIVLIARIIQAIFALLTLGFAIAGTSSVLGAGGYGKCIWAQK